MFCTIDIRQLFWRISKLEDSVCFLLKSTYLSPANNNHRIFEICQKKIASLYLRCKIHFAHPFISSWLPCQVMLWICCAKTAWRTLLRRLWVCPRRNRKTETTKDGGLMIFHMTKRRSVKLGPHINTHAKRVSHWWCPMTWNIKCGSAVALKFSLLSRCSTLQLHTGPFLNPKTLVPLFVYVRESL